MAGSNLKTLQVKTSQHTQFVDITGLIQSTVSESGLQDGACLVYVPHTTAAVTINENADPSVRVDIMKVLAKMVPDNLNYSHAEGNSPGHVKSSLIGCFVYVPVRGARLALGTWQGIFFCEFDGPRSRQVWVQMLRSV